MTELSHKILSHYQIRKTKKQKLAFIELLQKHFPELQVQTGGIPKSRNIIIGDVSNAKILLSAHYDTCAWLPIPNLVTPKNFILSLLYSIIMLLPVILITVLAGQLFSNLLIRYYFCLFLWFGAIVLMLAGPANKHTANDNTSGVITLLEILQTMSPEERKSVTIVLFDNEELGLWGSSYFRSKYKKDVAETLIINYDCVSDGDHMLFAVSKAARPELDTILHDTYTAQDGIHPMIEKAEKVYYPSDQANFKKSIAVASLKHNKLIGYYMDRIHTSKDTVFCERNIEYLREKTIEFLNRYT